MFECFDNIIGITRKKCDCDDFTPFDGFDQSISGYYLDTLTGMPIDILDTCSSDHWQKIEGFLKESISMFVTDVSVLIKQGNKRPRANLVDEVIGKYDGIRDHVLTNQYGVLSLNTGVKGGYFKLKQIGVTFKEAGPIVVTLADSLGNILGTKTINAIANKQTFEDWAIDLPLSNKLTNNLEYYFYYDGAGRTPIDTQNGCVSCGGVYSYDRSRTYATTSQKGFKQWVMAGATEIDDLLELDGTLPIKYNGKTLGLTLCGDFTCDANEILCKGSINPDNELTLFMADAIRHSLAVKIADYVQTTEEIGRANVLNSEQWAYLSEKWAQRYNDIVLYVGDQADISANDCYVCKDLFDVTRQGLFA